MKGYQNVTQDELEILEMFRRLNDEGQKLALCLMDSCEKCEPLRLTTAWAKLPDTGCRLVEVKE